MNKRKLKKWLKKLKTGASKANKKYQDFQKSKTGKDLYNWSKSVLDKFNKDF